MCLKPQPPRPIPPDIAAWGAQVLPPDDPFRRTGDHLYASLYQLLANDFASLSAPDGLTPMDMAFILALQDHLRLTFAQTATYLRESLAWKYALHLPLVHPGCPPNAIKAFATAVQTADPPRIGAVRYLSEALRSALSNR